METLEDGWRETTYSLDKHGTTSIFLPGMTTSIQHVRCSDSVSGSYSGVAHVRCEVIRSVTTNRTVTTCCLHPQRGAAKRALKWRQQVPPKRHDITFQNAVSFIYPVRTGA